MPVKQSTKKNKGREPFRKMSHTKLCSERRNTPFRRNKWREGTTGSCRLKNCVCVPNPTSAVTLCLSKLEAVMPMSHIARAQQGAGPPREVSTANTEMMSRLNQESKSSGKFVEASPRLPWIPSSGFPFLITLNFLILFL